MSIKITGQRNYPVPAARMSPPLPQPRQVPAPATSALDARERAVAAPHTSRRRRARRSQMTVRLPPGLKAQLAAFAERTGLSMNEIVCSAVAFATKG